MSCRPETCGAGQQNLLIKSRKQLIHTQGHFLTQTDLNNLMSIKLCVKRLKLAQVPHLLEEVLKTFVRIAGIADVVFFTLPLQLRTGTTENQHQSEK